MYRNVHTRFWSDPKVKRLSPDERYLFLYFITNEHTHVSGLYRIPKLYIQEETGLSRKAIDSAIDILHQSNLAHYDSETEQVWIVKMLCYQGHGSRIQAAIAQQLKTLHRSPLTKAFAETYQYPIDTLSENTPYPIDGLTVPVPVPVSVPDRGSRGKEKESPNGRIRVTFFTEDMKPDEYCLTYAAEHGITDAGALYQTMVDWHLKNGKGTKDLHASWRTFVNRAPQFSGEKPKAKRISAEEVAEYAKKQGWEI